MSKSILPGKNSRIGFTLIELLVTIAIVAILIALVFSVGGRAISNGQAVKCGANLRQIGQAFSQYLADNQGQFPDATGFGRPEWDMRIMGYLDTSGYDFLSPLIPSVGLSTAVPLPVSGLFKCPVDRQPRAAGKYPRSYTILSWTCNRGTGDYSPSLPIDIGIRTQLLQEPGKSVVLAECPAPAPGGTYGNVIGCGAYNSNTVRYDWSDLHRNRSNLLFADWHVELIPKSKAVGGPTLRARYFPHESASCISAGGPLDQ